jgi:hypothetical protein
MRKVFVSQANVVLRLRLMVDGGAGGRMKGRKPEGGRFKGSRFKGCGKGEKGKGRRGGGVVKRAAYCPFGVKTLMPVLKVDSLQPASPYAVNAQEKAATGMLSGSRRRKLRRNHHSADHNPATRRPNKE